VILFVFYYLAFFCAAVGHMKIRPIFL